MTYNEARIRIGVYFLLSWVLRIATGMILLTAVAKGFVVLNGTQGCGPLQAPCNSLQNGIASLINNIFFLAWIWLWLPDSPPQLWFLALFSSLGLCAVFFLLFTFFLDKARFNLLAALRRALAQERVRHFNQKSYSQSVGALSAGRDLSIGRIEQNINNDSEIRNWDSNFSKSPLGQVIIAASGGFLSFLLGKLVGG